MVLQKLRQLAVEDGDSALARRLDSSHLNNFVVFSEANLITTVE